jgi:hypothetical protein
MNDVSSKLIAVAGFAAIDLNHYPAVLRPSASALSAMGAVKIGQ